MARAASLPEGAAGGSRAGSGVAAGRPVTGGVLAVLRPYERFLVAQPTREAEMAAAGSAV